MDKLRVIELFAGVGGFRIGLEKANKDFFETVWANQWEPATKMQHAALVYADRFGSKGFSNQDINSVITEEIPDHDMMVGGFPCQDYSVATTLTNSKGIEGKKGVLWWSIYRILKEKGDKRPSIVFLENVDRLLLSPAKQRGRDFAIILECLNELGYIAEWRIINAAEYGMPQRRRRTYIVAYLKTSSIGKSFTSVEKLLIEDGIFAKAFPIDTTTAPNKLKHIQLSNCKKNRLLDITNNFNSNNIQKPFENTGVMINGKAYSFHSFPYYSGSKQTLGDILCKPEQVAEEFYILDEQIEKWEYFKGSKKEKRIDSKGYEYYYTEGAMSFPDSLDLPSRTIITSEGGKSPDRCRHVVKDQTGRLRRLTPIELERLNMFPDNHTKLEGITNSKRAFLMGNALVCGIVTKIGQEIQRRCK